MKSCYVSHPIAGLDEERVKELENRGLVYASVVLGVHMENIVLPRLIPAWCSIQAGRECPPGPTTPAGQGGEHTRTCYMRADIQALLDCDQVLVMPGWEHSWGCAVEVQVAVAAGIPLIFYSGASQGGLV